MTRKSHVLSNQQSQNSKIVENKPNEEQFLQKVNRSKKKKHKSKNHQQELLRNRKVKDVNLQSTNSARTCNDNKLDRNGWKEKKELKIPVAAAEIKNGEVKNNFEKTDTSQKKSRKHQNSTEIQKSADIIVASEKNACMFKKRIVQQSERQYGERSENYNCMANSDDRYNLHNTLKKHNNSEFYKNDHDKKYQNNRQLKHEKSNERSEKHIRVVKYINDSYKTNQLSNSIFLKSLNNAQEIPDSNIKYADVDIKTMIINKRGVNYIKGNAEKKYQYVKELMQQNDKEQNLTNKRNKHNWDFYSQNGQNTYSINNTIDKTDHSWRNKRNTKNIESAIMESSKKTNFEKNLTFVGSEFGNLKTTKDQTFSSDATVMDIDLNPSSLSDSTTFIHKDQDKSHDEKQKILTSSREMFTQTYDNQKYFNNNANPSIYEQNIIEHFTEENWTTQINSDKPHKESNQYSNIEIKRNNDDDNNIIRNVVNIDRFIEYFDEIWEGVIQEISGY